MNNQLKEIAVNVGNKAAPKLDCSAYRIIRRNGDVMSFEPVKIAIAITKAFLSATDRDPDELVQIVSSLTEHVVNALMSRRPEGGHIHIEDVQDLVEISLYRADYQSVAEEYRTYRQRRIAERSAQGQDESHLVYEVKGKDQRMTKLYTASLKKDIEMAAVGLDDVNVNLVVHETLRNIYNGIPVEDVNKAVIMAARTQIENEPQYDALVARLQLRDLAEEVFGSRVDFAEMRERYAFGFKDYIRTAIKHELANPVLAEYDLNTLARALEPSRDMGLTSLSMSTLYDRYFLHVDGRRIEMPQYFFMRVAMGMARNEIDRNFWAVKFYQILSSHDYMSSTPTLFNAGTLREQLSSCYVSTVPDDLDGIYEAIKENALLSKFAGGLGNDWTQVRAMGAHIKGTNGKSQGVIPFLKVVNDTAVAVNQCFSGDTLVLTQRGAVFFDQLQPSDLVLTADNVYAPIKQILVYDQKPDDQVLRFTVNGVSTAVTAGHPFFVFVPSKNGLDWVEAGQLQVGDQIAVPKDIYALRKNDGITVDFETDEAGEHHVSSVRRIDTSVFEFEGEDYNDRYKLIRIEAIEPGTATKVYDLIVDGNPSYLTQMGLAHNGGKRKGAVCAYLETWHADIEEFLELRKNTGDDRRRTHDMNTANWIPDLFMKRVMADGVWSLFSPDEVPELHDTYGRKFTELYEAYEQRGRNGELRVFKEISAKTLWRKMLTMLFETGHPWITFKDVCNIRSPQDHVGTVHSSNLCFTGDTLVILTNGARVQIRDLAELYGRHTKFQVPSAQWGSTAWVQEHNAAVAFKTGDWSTVVRVTMSNGESFRCTPEHELATVEGGWVQAQHAVGNVIEGYGVEDLTVVSVEYDGEDVVYDLTVDNAHNFYIALGDTEGILVHNCTEITLNNDVENETAVCNLGSVNLARHIRKNDDGQWEIDYTKLRNTVQTAVRMLDNVIDINFYPVDKARNSNLRHRPVGLGQMGHQDALLMMGLPFDSPEALEFGERVTEAISYYAIEASIELARVRGAYSTFQGSKWSKGMMPHDTLTLMAEERGTPVLAPAKETMDWWQLRENVVKYGIRNSNLMAIAPTATIANICGVTPSIEPLYQVLYVKSNLSGEFTVINEHLVARLKALGLWDTDMVREIKRYEGSIAQIDRIPTEVRNLFRTSFEVDPLSMVKGTARRQFWIDQAISLNLYMAQASGKRLDELYTYAWTSGLKTTYYLRTLGATSAEKSTGTGGELNAVPTQPEPKFCSIDNPDCEACQ